MLYWQPSSRRWSQRELSWYLYLNINSVGERRLTCRRLRGLSDNHSDRSAKVYTQIWEAVAFPRSEIHQPLIENFFPKAFNFASDPSVCGIGY